MAIRAIQYFESIGEPFFFTAIKSNVQMLQSLLQSIISPLPEYTAITEGVEAGTFKFSVTVTGCNGKQVFEPETGSSSKQASKVSRLI